MPCPWLRGLAMALLLAAGSVHAAELRIGFASALTGAYASTGARHRSAAEAAVRDLNHNGGVLGQPVRIVAVDDACGVEQAEQAAQQLVDAGIGFVVGHLCSHSSLMAASVYEAAGTAMMTTTASHPRLTEEGRGNVFRLIGRDDRQGRIGGDLLADLWSGGKIAFLHDGSPYGKGLVAAARDRLRQRGARAALEATYAPGATDHAALADRLNQAGIDVAYLGGYGPDAARILRAVRERGGGLQIVGGHALGMDEFWDIAGPQGDGTIFTGRRDVGLRPGSAVLPAGLEASFPGRRPSSLATYAAVQVWAQAVRRAGSTLPAALLRALRRGEFDTVIGQVAFDDKGDLRGGDWQWQVWSHGRQELLNRTLAKAR